MVQGDAAGGTKIGVAWIDVEARLGDAQKQLDAVSKEADAAMQRVAESAGLAFKQMESIGSAAEGASERFSDMAMEADASFERVSDNVGRAADEMLRSEKNAQAFGEQMGLSAALAAQALVEVDERTERLSRRLKDVEAQSDRSMERVRASAQGTAAGVEEVGESAEESGASLGVLATIASVVADAWGVSLRSIIGRFGTWAAITMTVRAGLAKAATAAGALMRAFAPVAIISAILHAISGAINGINAAIEIGTNIARVWTDTLSRDTETARAAIREIGDELERLPLVGRAWAAQWKIAAGAVRRDTELIGEGFGELRGFLLDFPILGAMVVRPLDNIAQSALGIREEMEATRDAIAEAEQQARRHAAIQERTHSIITSMTEAEHDIQNRLALSRLEGVERVKEAERQRHEAAMRQAREQLQALEKQRNEQLKPLQRRAEVQSQIDANVRTQSEGEAALEREGITGGPVSRSEVADEIAAIEENYNRIRRSLEGKMREINIASAELRKRGVEEATDEERQAMRRADDRLNSLRSELHEQQLRLEGRRFEAQAVAIRRGYEGRILEAEREGHQQRADLLRRLRDEEIRQVEADERAKAEARIAAQREATQSVADDLREIERDIMREGIESDTLREAFDIGTEFGDRIADATDRIAELRKEMDELRRGGVTAGEREQMTHLAQQLEMLELSRERLGTLRNMRLEGIDVGGEGGGAGRMTGSLAREIGNDRITRGEGLTKPQDVRDKEAEQQRAEMIEILRESRESFG